MAIRVGLLGMGRIAAGFDNPGDDAVTTHLKAILGDPRLALIAAADTDRDRAARELARFGVALAPISPEDFLETALDVVCIATPDGTHLDYLDRMSDRDFKVILVEKPLEPDRVRRTNTYRKLEARGTQLVVHHTRRWIPQLASWIAAGRAGDYGSPVSAVMTYNRGLRHNGVHALDLVGAFLGLEMAGGTRIGPAHHDFSDLDPTISGTVLIRHGTGDVPLHIVGVDGRKLSAFEFDLRFDRARIRIFDEGGVRAELYLPSASTPGFADELSRADVFEDVPAAMLKLVWSNIANHLGSGEPLRCEGRSALATYNLVDDVIRTLNGTI